MKLIILFALVANAALSIIDVFEATNGHEPRVAINCGRIPFYIDLQTGAWVEDSTSVSQCDQNKEDVKKYCQKVYPKLNITNIVEANKPTKFNNWCKPTDTQCTEAKKVVPYRCLVNEYEADALMVPEGCKFDHINDPKMCLTHDQWKKNAAGACKVKYDMSLRDYGILLSCKTDYFTGVEFVCCPKHHKKQQKKKHGKHHEKKHGRHHKKHNRKSFLSAIQKFRKYLPIETKGCDRSTYETKQTLMENRHHSQIAAIVNEWDEAEKRYNKLKAKDPVAAEEKMKRTLEVFRQTLAALEQESKNEKSRLRTEHADCINTQISKSKRDSMIAYLKTIQESPVNAEKILKAVRKFIQVCEHDRVHSLRHFEHVRNRNAKKAEGLRRELLLHLKNLNKVVNESMALLNYLPEIAKKFGLTGSIGGAILKPRVTMPEAYKDNHHHAEVQKILKEATKKYIKNKPSNEIEELNIVASIIPNTKAPVEPKPNSDRSTKEYGSVKVNFIGKDFDEPDDIEDEEEERHSKHHGAHGSPFAINVILGLCCGILVIMLLVVIAMVVRRQRVARTRVVLAENNDDREHLLQMQKNGFENPTYKFFYY